MWTAPPRSQQAEMLYLAAEADRRAHPERYVLDPESLLARAPDKALADPDDWREGFERYVQSAREEGRLNALGIRSIAASALGRLKARADMAEAFEAHPERRSTPIERPIFVIGGWRTGTTLLQRLLAATPGLRGLYPAELSAPARFVGLSAEARAPLIEASSAHHAMLHVLSPTLNIVHPSGANLAEECVLAMGTDFRNWGFTSTVSLPSYARWLAEQDMTGAYRRYADILRLLDDGGDRRWILKAPAHTAALKHLFAVFPDACVIHLHRDVVQTVTSGATLFSVFRAINSDSVDPVEVGRYQLDTTCLWFERAMRDREQLSGAKIIDLAFSELVADPIAAVRGICESCAVPWDEAADQSTGAALQALNAAHGDYRCAPADFGLDPDEIRSRLSAYSARFGLA